MEELNKQIELQKKNLNNLIIEMNSQKETKNLLKLNDEIKEKQEFINSLLNFKLKFENEEHKLKEEIKEENKDVKEIKIKKNVNKSKKSKSYDKPNDIELVKKRQNNKKKELILIQKKKKSIK